MKDSSKRKPQTTMILILILCMAAGITVFSSLFELIQSQYFSSANLAPPLGNGEQLPAEEGMYKGRFNFARWGENTVKEAHERTLKKFYQNRFYAGAPPQIPHPIRADFTDEKMDCLSCHTNGGYVEKFKSYAPISPHPQWVNCRQCHVPQQTNALFKPTQWMSLPPPDLNQRDLVSGPPRIPHSLQMRENCLSCHGGPGAAREIRVSHPERLNCMQCHVTNKAREKSISGTFKSSYGPSSVPLPSGISDPFSQGRKQ